MLRLRSLSNKYKRRTLKPVYTHTQGYPYAAQLSSAFSRTGGQLEGTTTTGVTDNTMAAILPGAVLNKLVGEVVTLAGASDNERAFGLSANFVGGQLDELGEGDEIGVWRGVGSTYHVLAPAFVDTGLATDAAAEAGTDTTEVYLRSDATGRLARVAPGDASGGADAVGDIATLAAAALGRTARLIRRIDSNAIEIELLV